MAIALLKRYRALYPNDPPDKIWDRIYPQAIQGWDSLNPRLRAKQRRLLRERVRCCLKARERNKTKQADSAGTSSSGNLPS